MVQTHGPLKSISCPMVGATATCRCFSGATTTITFPSVHSREITNRSVCMFCMPLSQPISQSVCASVHLLDAVQQKDVFVCHAMRIDSKEIYVWMRIPVEVYLPFVFSIRYLKQHVLCSNKSLSKSCLV